MGMLSLKCSRFLWFNKWDKISCFKFLWFGAFGEFLCSFFLLAQKKEPKKRAGKPHRSAGFAMPTHNSFNY
jgi:hypothetical protein